MEKMQKVILTKDQIQNRIYEMAKEIDADFERDILAVAILNGAFMFFSDLIKALNKDVEVEFIKTSSYGYSEVSSGRVDILSKFDKDISGREILLVDDILDSGRTLKKVCDILHEKNPKSIKTAILLKKPTQVIDFVPDYVGFEIEDDFVAGYGLNYGKYMRNIPYVFTYVQK